MAADGSLMFILLIAACLIVHFVSFARTRNCNIKSNLLFSQNTAWNLASRAHTHNNLAPAAHRERNTESETLYDYDYIIPVNTDRDIVAKRCRANAIIYLIIRRADV